MELTMNINIFMREQWFMAGFIIFSKIFY